MGLVDGKVAFITGAGRGQGRADAVRLAEEGADIIAVDICADIEAVPYPLASEEDLEETARLVEKTGRQVLTQRADVREYGQIREAVVAGLERFGHIDTVVANAGVATYGADRSEEGALAAWNACIGVNLTGAWNTLRACAPPMVERGKGGSMIVISSTAGLWWGGTAGLLSHENYAASKHGVVGVMRQFAALLSDASIRVNSVHPTVVDTPIANNEAAANFVAGMPDRLSDYSNLLPVDALQARDIADAVLFLASDLSRYITGVTLPVDAGFLAK